jgi:adenylate cyclase
LCRRAIAIFPGYGQAHSLLAWAILRRSIWSGDFKTSVPEVSAEAREALALDDRDPWAYVAQGMLFARLRRFDDAVRTFRKTLELNPNFALAHAVLSLGLTQKSASDEAIASAQRAMRLSPGDRLVGTYAAVGVAMAYFAAARYGEAVTAAHNLVERAPGDARGHFLLAAALAMHGDLHGAVEAREALLTVQPGFSISWMMENLPFTGEMGERLQEGLRKAGVPDK